ncbi:MAG: hypothetical protein ACK5NN_07980 [Sphingomonadaceae bacterium]
MLSVLKCLGIANITSTMADNHLRDTEWAPDAQNQHCSSLEWKYNKIFLCDATNVCICKEQLQEITIKTGGRQLGRWDESVETQGVF